MSLLSNSIIEQPVASKAASVQEKILLEKQFPFSSEKIGPTVDLYFHELAKKKSFGQNVLRFLASLILSLAFAISLPIVALLIKISSSEPVLKKREMTGRRGTNFIHYSYSTKDSASNKEFLFGAFLRKTGLAKLPSVINIWKGNLNLVGPQPYPVEWCNEWNNQFTDFYKRFSFEPGFLGVAEPVTNPQDINQVNRALRQELHYILNPSFKADRRRLLRRVSFL
ncbi:MAG TPA: sugar transferase [Balneolaceae bacterium]|nr:sugar transferase [Balneolaceae bacterium]